jgi:hypothetical protein
MAATVLTLQVVANDLSCKSHPPDESEAQHIPIVAGTLTATVERSGGDPPIEIEQIEPGNAHAFRLRPVGVGLILSYNNHVPVVVPYAVHSSCG